MMAEINFDAMPDETKAYISQLQAIHFSDNQILGLFFVLGALVATPGSEEERNYNKGAISKLAPFDETIPIDEFIGPRWVSQEIVFEEFMSWLPVTWDFRQVEFADMKPRKLLTPQSHQLFGNMTSKVATMADAHRLYLDFYETLGRRMRELSVDVSDAVPSGIFQIQLFQMIDRQATRSLITHLRDLLSPMLKAIRDFGICGAPERLYQQLHTQIALQGLWGGLDERFMSVAWPFQSWLFFKDGEKLPGVESLSHEDFWNHACEHGTSLLMKHFDNIPHLSDTTVKLDALPPWGDENFCFETVDRFIWSVWGYDQYSNQHYTEVLHYRACMIHCIYSALCKETETSY